MHFKIAANQKEKDNPNRNIGKGTNRAFAKDKLKWPVSG